MTTESPSEFTRFPRWRDSGERKICDGDFTTSCPWCSGYGLVTGYGGDPTGCSHCGESGHTWPPQCEKCGRFGRIGEQCQRMRIILEEVIPEHDQAIPFCEDADS